MTATWTAPRTWSVGELTTAALMNQHMRDNFDWLKTPTANRVTSMSVATSSAVMVDVTGSSISLTSNGGGFDVFYAGTIVGSGAATATFALNFDGSDVFTVSHVISTSVQFLAFPYHIAAVGAGAHTFKMRVLTNSGTVTFTGILMYAVERGN